MVKYFLIILALIFVSCNHSEKEIVSEIKSPYSDKPIVLSRKFTESKLYLHRLELSDLRILRNEIYARRGYIFKSTDLSTYFSKYDWYTPKYDSKEIDQYLTDIDKLNIEVIIEAERKIKEREELKEKRKKWLNEFTFQDLMDVIPDIIYIAKDSIWDGFDDEEWQKFYQFRDKEEGLLKRFNMNKPIAGKIKMNDSIYVIKLTHASDLESFTNFEMVNINNGDYPEEELISESRLLKLNNSISAFNEFIVLHGHFFNANYWEIKYEKDKTGKKIEIQRETVGVFSEELYYE